jgi:protease I
MAGRLSGCVIALLISDGVRRERLSALRARLLQLGARVHILGLHPSPIRADDGAEQSIVGTSGDVGARYYDGLIVSHGRSVEEMLASDDAATALLVQYSEDHLPLGAIGNGVALLADATVIAGCRVAADTGIEDRVRAADGLPASAPVVSDHLITTGLADCNVVDFVDQFAQEVGAVIARDYVDEVSDESFPASDPHSGAAAIR